MIHIHNGDVMVAAARRAAIPGEHLAYRESLVTGRVNGGAGWIEARARAIAEAYGLEYQRVRTDLGEQELALERARSDGGLVLWFEHDLYCLIHLIYLLQRFGHDTSLSLVWSPWPLAEHEARDLYRLYECREAVGPALISLADRVWGAYTSADPTALNDWLEQDLEDFPFLREGLALHASRFPSEKNGLGAIEQQLLGKLAEGRTDFRTLFHHVNAHVPRFGFGDTEVFRHLQRLANCTVPLITLSGQIPDAVCTITATGKQVWRGDVDDVAINVPDLWLGGTHVTRATLWRWTGTKLSRDARWAAGGAGG